MKKLFAISVLILISSLLITNLSTESMERRIISNALYTTSTSKADEVLAFTIIPIDYLKQSESGQRKLLMKKYDSEVYLEPLRDTGDECWIGWSFCNNWYKLEGTCFTFRSLKEDTNGNRLYTITGSTRSQHLNSMQLMKMVNQSAVLGVVEVPPTIMVSM